MLKNKLSAYLILALLTFPFSVSAGGTVAAGWHNGGYLPKDDSLITWSSYGSPLTDRIKDILQAATLSLDLEVEGFRLMPDRHPELSAHHTFFSFVGGDPDPKCLDDIPGGCDLGKNQCLVWEKVGSYKLCAQNRIRIYLSNIQASAEKSGEDLDVKLFRIFRHEWTHVLGFPDGVGGPTSNGDNKFTKCQLAQLNIYVQDPTVPTWTVVTPEECQ